MTKDDLVIPIIVTVVVIAAVSTAYFTLDSGKTMEDYNRIYDGIRIKVTYDDNDVIKVFALAKNNELLGYKTFKGNPIPEHDSIVIGYDEAKMMVEEGIFLDVGDNINGLFGIDTRVEGILAKTDSPIDDFHLLDKSQFDMIEGQEGKMYVEIGEDKMPKLFLLHEVGEEFKKNIMASEGDLASYRIYEIDYRSQKLTYYPVILGSKEAKMMRDEGLFDKVGENIEGFFGRDVVIVAVLEETGTLVDMMHLIPPLKEGGPA